VFGFSPGNGVHDIHMNQGNSQEFRRDDGVWQDGALLLPYPTQDQWVGGFLVDLVGWAVADAPKRRMVLNAESLPAGETIRILVRPLSSLVTAAD
jgi:uncharacterized protein YukJ